MTPRKPQVLLIGQYLAAIAAIGGVIGLILAPFDFHLYSIGPNTVGGREFLARMGIPFVAAVGVIGVVAVGLFRDRPWARPAMVAVWPICAVFAGWDALQSS